MRAGTFNWRVAISLGLGAALCTCCHSEGGPKQRMVQRLSAWQAPTEVPTDQVQEPGDTHLPAGPLVGTLASSRVREASGLVASRKNPGTFWTHGDSGNPSMIVAFDLYGEVLAEVRVADAPNIDWEDICADEQGHLYIGDIGDGGHPAVRYIYKIDEPDARHAPSGPISYVEKYEFRYPGERRFDAEALFVHDGNLYVIAKSRWSAVLYRLDLNQEENAELTRVTSLPAILATAADVSADEKRLVICSYFSLWVFPIDGSDKFVDYSAAKSVRYQTDGRIEGCCFAGDDVLLVAEDGRVFRITAEQIESRESLILR